MKNIEKLLLSSYITNASYIDGYWSITKEGFSNNLSKIGLESLKDKNQEEKFKQHIVNSLIPINKQTKPTWHHINELDAVLVVDVNIDNKIKRFISLRGTEANGFYDKLAIPLYLVGRYLNFSKSFKKFQNTINSAITEVEGNGDYDEVVICGHSYGGAMVGEFFRQKNNEQYNIPIIGATFGSPGSGEFFLKNHWRNFLSLTGNLAQKISGKTTKPDVVQNLYEFTNSTDPVPYTRFISGNKFQGQHIELQCENIGHSMSSTYIEHIKNLYTKEQSSSDLMYKIFEKTDMHYSFWKQEYDYAKEHPIANNLYLDKENDASIRATNTLLGFTNIRSKKTSHKHTNFLDLISSFTKKIFKKETYYDILLQEEQQSSLETLEMAGIIKGMNAKKNLQK